MDKNKDTKNKESSVAELIENQDSEKIEELKNSGSRKFAATESGKSEEEPDKESMERKHQKALRDSFPASDPSSVSR